MCNIPGGHFEVSSQVVRTTLKISRERNAHQTLFTIVENYDIMHHCHDINIRVQENNIKNNHSAQARRPLPPLYHSLSHTRIHIHTSLSHSVGTHIRNWLYNRVQ